MSARVTFPESEEPNLDRELSSGLSEADARQLIEHFFRKGPSRQFWFKVYTRSLNERLFVLPESVYLGSPEEAVREGLLWEPCTDLTICAVSVGFKRYVGSEVIINCERICLGYAASSCWVVGWSIAENYESVPFYCCRYQDPLLLEEGYSLGFEVAKLSIKVP